MHFEGRAKRNPHRQSLKPRMASRFLTTTAGREQVPLLEEMGKAQAVQVWREDRAVEVPAAEAP